MNIIFLDIDGVLNNSLHLKYSKIHVGQEFDPICIRNLKGIIKETGAKLVITSTWRRGETIQSLNEGVLSHYGLAEYVVAHTPILEEQPRGTEIAMFLLTTDLPISNFIIIDDNADMGDFLGRLVRTNPRRGLDNVKKKEAIKLMKTPFTQV